MKSFLANVITLSTINNSILTFFSHLSVCYGFICVLDCSSSNIIQSIQYQKKKTLMLQSRMLCCSWDINNKVEQIMWNCSYSNSLRSIYGTEIYIEKYRGGKYKKKNRKTGQDK